MRKATTGALTALLSVALELGCAEAFRRTDEPLLLVGMITAPLLFIASLAIIAEDEKVSAWLAALLTSGRGGR